MDALDLTAQRIRKTYNTLAYSEDEQMMKEEAGHEVQRKYMSLAKAMMLFEKSWFSQVRPGLPSCMLIAERVVYSERTPYAFECALPSCAPQEALLLAVRQKEVEAGMR